jgi:cob(I)alamin adenosyltransferase
MPIYTKFGDKGTTKLLGGSAVPKDNPHVEAYGNVDELSTTLGIVMAFSEAKEMTGSLARIQRDLFVIGAELASKGGKGKKVSPARISEIESEIDKLETTLPPLKNFILSGGSKTASLLHHARTVCRRAERSVVALSHKEKVSPETLTYLNRVGDLLFVQARFVNYKKKVPEVVWKGR